MAWTVNDVIRHKITSHLPETLVNYLQVHPSEERRGFASDSALRDTHQKHCDFEIELFRADHELRDTINGHIRSLSIERLLPEQAELVYEIVQPIWRRHRRRQAELKKARQQEKEEKEEKDAKKKRRESSKARTQLELEASKSAQERQAKIAVENLEREAAEFAAKREGYLQRAKKLFYENFFEFERLQPSVELEVTKEDLVGIRLDATKNVLEVVAPGKTFDEDQLLAISTIRGDTLVTARAGSGKTTVLAYRAAFMLLHCGVNAKEILLVTFNKAAAEELRQRIQQILVGVISEEEINTLGGLPEIRTFHSIAYRINEGYRRENGLPGINKYLKDDDRLGREKEAVVKQVLSDFVEEAENRNKINSLMLRHFATDWEAILKPAKLADSLRGIDWENTPRRSIDGTFVKSRGERLIADVLFRYGIIYEYEKPLPDKTRGYLRPDFTISDSHNRPLVIEFLGVRNNPEYDRDNQLKLKTFAELQIPVLCLFPKDTEDTIVLTSKIIDYVSSHVSPQQPFTELTDEELLAGVMDRATLEFDELLNAFISRCRVEGFSPSALNQHIERMAIANELDSVERDFYSIAQPLFASYLSFLELNTFEDFEGLIGLATEAIRNGYTFFNNDVDKILDLSDVRYLCIDEYQDYSKSFNSLVSAIREISGAFTFAVGDDWQSINSFMGALPDVFIVFESEHEAVTKINIKTNYRSTSNIVDFGNSMMVSTGGTPQQALKQKLSDRPIYGVDVRQLHPDGQPLEMKLNRFAGSKGIAAKRIVTHALKSNYSTTVLSHFNSPSGLYLSRGKNQQSGLSQLSALIKDQTADTSQADKIVVSTTNSYKGKESDVIIVWDSQSYPFIHPRWTLNRIFGVSLERLVAEERRLAYVAVTRAKQIVFLLHEGDLSNFFNGIVIPHHPQPPSRPAEDEKWLRVSNGFGIKDLLKQQEFVFDSHSKSWVLILRDKRTIDDTKNELERNKPNWLLESLKFRYKVLLTTATESYELR